MSDRSIAVAYHIACLGHWEEVVEEQLTLVKQSGLLEVTDQFLITLGEYDRDDPRWDPAADFIESPGCLGLPDWVALHRTALKDCEFPALQLLQDQCLLRSPGGLAWCCYFHTKGVSRPESKPRQDHRQLMNYRIIERWQQAVGALEAGADSTGICPGVFHEWPGQPRHYSGNFWWARSEHLARLKPVRSLNWEHRFEAEAWISWGVDSQTHSLYESGVNHNHEDYPPERYR